MPNYAMIRDGQCVATGTLVTLPERTDIIERVAGVPSVGDVLEAGEWVTPPAPEPEPSTILTRLGFMDRFTTAELVAIYTEAKTNVETEIFLDKLRADDEIDTADVRTRDGVAQLVAAGLIDEGRADELLAPVA